MVSLCKNTLQTLMVSVFQKQCCTANYAGSYSALSGEQKTQFFTGNSFIKLNMHYEFMAERMNFCGEDKI